MYLIDLFSLNSLSGIINTSTTYSFLFTLWDLANNLQTYTRAYNYQLLQSWLLLQFFLCLGVLVVSISFVTWSTSLERGGDMCPSLSLRTKGNIASLRETSLLSHLYLPSFPEPQLLTKEREGHLSGCYRVSYTVRVQEEMLPVLNSLPVLLLHGSYRDLEGPQ